LEEGTANCSAITNNFVALSSQGQVKRHLHKFSQTAQGVSGDTGEMPVYAGHIIESHSGNGE
jgi:hypothetical protein